MYYKLFRPGLVGEFLDKIKNKDKNFLILYQKKDRFIYDFKGEDIFDSNVIIHDENLGEKMVEVYLNNRENIQIADFECAKLLYENLDLTPLQASNPNFWNYLHHFDMYKYIQLRWQNQGNIQTHIKGHFLMSLSSQVHLINFPLSGLWWSIYLSIVESKANKYELSEVFFSNNSFRTVSFGSMNFMRYKPAALAILEFIKTNSGRLTKDRSYTKLGDEISQFINILGGDKPLSFFDKNWFIEKLEKKFNVKSKKINFIIDADTKNLTKSLCYFCLNSNGDYMISEVQMDNFDYCIRIDEEKKTWYLLLFYFEGYISKIKIDPNILKIERNKLFTNGLCPNMKLIDLQITKGDTLFGISYLTIKNTIGFKVIDGSLAQFIGASNINDEGYKIISNVKYKDIKYKQLPFSLKSIFYPLIQDPSGIGVDVSDSKYNDQWFILKRYWQELFILGALFK